MCTNPTWRHSVSIWIERADLVNKPRLWLLCVYYCCYNSKILTDRFVSLSIASYRRKTKAHFPHGSFRKLLFVLNGKLCIVPIFYRLCAVSLCAVYVCSYRLGTLRWSTVFWWLRRKTERNLFLNHEHKTMQKRKYVTFLVSNFKCVKKHICWNSMQTLTNLFYCC